MAVGAVAGTTAVVPEANNQWPGHAHWHTQVHIAVSRSLGFAVCAGPTPVQTYPTFI